MSVNLGKRVDSFLEEILYKSKGQDLELTTEMDLISREESTDIDQKKPIIKRFEVSNFYGQGFKPKNHSRKVCCSLAGI